MVLKSGGRYTIEDVRLLDYHLRLHRGKLDIQVICLSDKVFTPTKIYGISFLPLRDNWEGWWSKMNIFAPFYDDMKPFLFFDLDTVILDEYSFLVPKGDPEEFIALTDWYTPSVINSSVMWVPDTKEIVKMWYDFDDHSKEMMRQFRGDQDFIFNRSKNFVRRWQDRTNGIQTMKPRPRCKPLLRKPEGVPVICFHGKPGVWEAANTIDWVKDYVNEYTYGK